MASGSAVLVSDSGGINEYAQHGKNCLIYPPKDLTSLHANLILLLQQKQVRDTLIEEGIKTSYKFTWENSVKQFLSIIDEI